jgi:hypothetical protein
MITKILNKYNAFSDYYYPNIANPYDESAGLKNVDGLENALQKKWKDHIPKGWYGFAIGSPCPESWFNIIDEFLDYLVTIDPQLKIHQIKMKFGGIRFYVEVRGKDEEQQEFIDLQIAKLESQLFDKKLIY